MNRQRYAANQQNTAKFKAGNRTIGPVSNTIMLIILACLLGLIYLAQVTKTNALSYAMNDMSNKQTQLTAEHDNLAVSAARLQSLQRVQDSDTAKSLVSLSPSGTVRN
ncbi:MAG: hypothetical protein ABI354_00120 [Candidatus Saccharimonadales bacterium]